MRVRTLVGTGFYLVASGCGQADDSPRAPSLTVDSSSERAAEPVPTTSPGPSERKREAWAGDWSEHLGRCVIAEGYVEGTKGGHRLNGGTWAIDVSFQDPGAAASFGSLRGGARVRVRGKVTQRSDLPVFIQKPGEPIEQGMPVPAGTDLEKARRRYVLEGESANTLRTIEAVEANLTAHLGRELGLAGVVWSLNGHFWFNHDGVDVHVDGQESIPGWSGLHGRAMTLQGTLSRRAMPRIDQIALKPNRDLGDAFVINARAMSATPGWPLDPCPTGR